MCCWGVLGFPLGTAGTISPLVRLHSLWGRPTTLLHRPSPNSWIHMTVHLLPQEPNAFPPAPEPPGHFSE
ncbi:hypothetical protein SCLCIDRAFT_377296 [Scleroderma citrinum Foug A]|uniref:Uncharacterized protein n=1 Tax=Scleroderma citrinum Foug A TaxID=1036808 RepID=A0A0C2YXX7_9AGAM|nr:hypothetical protein SCLCIDRAFT_377296 [Scleroderma citrinum Foug A]